MPLLIEALHVTVHVKAPRRARFGELEQHEPRQRSLEPVYRLPPPTADTTGESVVEVQGELDPDVAAWDADELDVNLLAERVYDLMRYDVRVSRERSGGPL